MSEKLFQKYPITLYNSASQSREKFEPLHSPFVGMYVCGPTVYSDVHIGNVRTFTSFDVVFRFLTHLGYKVRYVRNITDVGHLVDDADGGEDKIGKQAKLMKMEPMEVVQYYTDDFRNVMRLYNILPPSIEPTATGHIIEQIEMTQQILDAGYAYEKNGSVYFDVRKYHKDYHYGKLSGRLIDDLYANTRELSAQDEKKDSLDFALWKKAEPQHIMKWNSPWGKGFPGWHIECSVMSTKYLGKQFDIHGGGMDLKFPHHECEIAQGKAANKIDAAKYWLHGNMLTINGQKMSKSVGNVFTPHQLITGNSPLLEKAYSPMTVRFFMLQAHYRSTLDFSNEAIQASEKGFKKLMHSLDALEDLKYISGEVNSELDKEIYSLCESCYIEMCDDFNTPKVIAVLFELSAKINSFTNGQLTISSVSENTFEQLKSTFKAFFINVLGLKKEESEGNSQSLDKVVSLLIEVRKQAKSDKNYALSDKIRDQLKDVGILLKDNKDGSISYEIL